jgi:hypothetical protein
MDGNFSAVRKKQRKRERDGAMVIFDKLDFLLLLEVCCCEMLLTGSRTSEAG